LKYFLQKYFCDWNQYPTLSIRSACFLPLWCTDLSNPNRPSWICMSIRLHISLVDYIAFIVVQMQFVSILYCPPSSLPCFCMCVTCKKTVIFKFNYQFSFYWQHVCHFYRDISFVLLTTIMFPVMNACLDFQHGICCCKVYQKWLISTFWNVQNSHFNFLTKFQLGAKPIHKNSRWQPRPCWTSLEQSCTREWHPTC